MLAHLVYKFVFYSFLSNRVCQISSSNLANFFTLYNQKEFRSSREVEFSFSSLRSQTVILNHALFFEFQLSISTQFIPVFLFVLKQPKKLASTRRMSKQICRSMNFSWNLPCVTYCGRLHITFFGLAKRRSGSS